jgi:hypothetical protein
MPGKTIRSLALGVVTTVAPVAGLQAEVREPSNMAACRSEVEKYYGQQVELQIINRRHTSDGLKVKLAARLDRDNTEFLYCRLSYEDLYGQATAVRSAANLVARVEPVPVVR